LAVASINSFDADTTPAGSRSISSAIRLNASLIPSALRSADRPDSGTAADADGTIRWSSP